MYTTIRQYRGNPDQIAEMAHVTDERFADKLAEQDGFVAYEMVDAGDGTIFTITVFSDREMAERSNELAADFIRTSLQGYDLERTSAHTGSVIVNRARNDMLEMVHA